MKRSILVCWTALIMFLSGCASVPDDVKTNNKTTENNCSEIEGEKITIEEALKDSSDIYNNDYQQIKIAPGLDLDFSNITGVTDYTLSPVAWDETDHRKVLDFFSGQGLYGKTVSEDSGTAIDGDWVQFSDGEHTITMDYAGFVAYNDESDTFSDSVICDSFKYGDAKCQEKNKLSNGEYSFNEVNEYISDLIKEWKTIDKHFDLVPAEIYVWETPSGSKAYDIFYAKESNGMKFDYELSTTMSENSNYMYLNVFVDTYGKISFWSNNNGIYSVDSSSKVEGNFYTLDDALKIVEKKFTPETDFTIYEIMLSYEMLYDSEEDVFTTKPCWKFNFDDNSGKDDLTHKMVRNVFVDITNGKLYDSYSDLASW